MSPGAAERLGVLPPAPQASAPRIPRSSPTHTALQEPAATPTAGKAARAQEDQQPAQQSAPQEDEPLDSSAPPAAAAAEEQADEPAAATPALPDDSLLQVCTGRLFLVLCSLGCLPPRLACASWTVAVAASCTARCAFGLACTLTPWRLSAATCPPGLQAGQQRRRAAGCGAGAPSQGPRQGASQGGGDSLRGQQGGHEPASSGTSGCTARKKCCNHAAALLAFPVALPASPCFTASAMPASR